ncbi:MAG: metallopeptidase TldD-related protein [Candidatus Dormibacteraeota bacterium]|jgi:predicted Zn-dependent protease|nr:metallopeptidase TldD-related protein [Candidatus Dormibacteraeota bacterium]
MRLEEVVGKGLDSGAAVVLASHASSTNCRIANNTVTTSGSEDSTSAALAAITDDRVGVRAADVQAAADVTRLAEEAAKGAESSPPAPDAMPLLGPLEAASQAGIQPPVEDEGISAVIPALEAALEASRRDGLELYAYLQSSAQTELLGTRTGVLLQSGRTTGSLSMTLKTKDHLSSVWSGGMARSLNDLDAARMYSRLAARLGWTKRRVELPPGPYEVILEPSAVADMLIRLGWEMHARGSDEGRTVFAAGGASRVGEQMYSREVTLESDPGDPEMPAADFVRTVRSSEYSSIFDNGMAAPRTSWIERGVQQDLICPRRWAQDHNHPVRADAENLLMRGTDTSLEQMISTSRRSLLVTSFWYIRDVDPSSLLLTGLTRDGLFLIENGEVVGAVNNFRFNESPVRVLSRTTEIGRAELALSREMGDSVYVKAPPLRVDGFFMSSLSEAI